MPAVVFLVIAIVLLSALVLGHIVLIEKAPANFPTLAAFKIDLSRSYVQAMQQAGGRVLLKAFAAQIFDVFAGLYEREFLDPGNQRQQLKIRTPLDAYKATLDCFVQSLSAFTTKIPSFATQALHSETSEDAFSVPLFNRLLRYDHATKTDKELDIGTWYFEPGVREAYEALAEPFRRNAARLLELGVFDWSRTSYSGSVSDPGNFHDHHSSADYFDKSIRREWDRKFNEWQKSEDEAAKRVAAWQWPLVGTPLFRQAANLLPGGDIRIPFAFPAEARFSGHWIVAPPGRGKTTLLHHLFQHDLEQVKKGQASIIVMDSKGEFIQDIPRLGLFGRGEPLEGRLCLIDPSDAEYPPALNPLQIVTGSRRRSVHTVNLLEYIFSALLEAKLTPLQSTLFRAVLRALVQYIPNATIETFRDIINNGYEPYAQYVAKDPDLHSFFIKEFPEKTYRETRQQIAWRLRLLMENEVIKSMFMSPTTKIDIAAEMDAGKIIVINNSKAVLGDEGTEIFGRLFIALVLGAAQQRSSRQADQKLPVYFYIDECHTVIHRDDKIASILDECRSQKIALIMAHQRLAQISSANVLDALSNCAIRFANSDEDASQLAPRLRTTADTLRSQPRGSFVAFVRDAMSEAQIFKVPNRPLENLAKSSDAEFAVIREGMRRAYCQNAQTAATTNQYDLRWTITISPRVARDGGTVKEQNLNIRIPPNTLHGAVFRLKNKGAPKPDGTFGHLFVTVNVPGHKAQPRLPNDGDIGPSKDW